MAVSGPGGGETFRLKSDLSGWQIVRDRPAVAGGEAAAAGEVVVGVGRTWLMATNSGLKSSDDLGASWHAVQGELGADSVQTLYRHPERPDTLFAAKFGVIYRSTDGGRSWRRISPELWPTKSVRQLLIMPGSPGRLLVLTHQQGLWALDLETGRR